MYFDKIPKKGEPGYWDFMKEKGVDGLIRLGHGRPRKIESPQKLWEYACEYFKEVDETPFKKKDFIRGGDRAGDVVDIDTVRPYTWAGLDSYLVRHEIISSIEDYRLNSSGRYNDYIDVIKAIQQVMYDNKFEGAAVGVFNANIIMRELQIADHTKTDITATMKTEVDYSKLSEEALNEIALQSPTNIEALEHESKKALPSASADVTEASADVVYLDKNQETLNTHESEPTSGKSE